MITAFLLGLSLGACVFTLAWMLIVRSWRRTAARWQDAARAWEVVARKWQANYEAALELVDTVEENAALSRKLNRTPTGN